MDNSDTSINIVFVILGLLAFIMVSIGFVRLLGGKNGDPPVTVPPPSRHARNLVQWDLLKLRYAGTSDPDSFVFERDGYTVRVSFVRTMVSDTEQVVTQLTVAGDLAPIDLGPEPMRASKDLQTGDENFDGLAQISADPAMALAVLGAEVRRKLGPALMQGWTVDKSGASSQMRRKFSGEHLDGMASHIEAGLVLARLLARPRDLLATLVSRLQSEPSVTGRLAIALGVPHAIRDDATHRQALAALPDPEVRLLLATRLDHPDLWNTLPEPALIALVHRSDVRIVEAAITALARTGTVLAIPDLKRFASRGGELGRLATDVVLMIQARLSGSRGDLALAAESDGQLALVDPKVPR